MKCTSTSYYIMAWLLSLIRVIMESSDFDMSDVHDPVCAMTESVQCTESFFSHDTEGALK